MKKLGLFIAMAVPLLALLESCDPAKNTFINRAYHSTTAQYNGYFNANLLLDQAIETYRQNYPEDYYSLLPIEVYPTERDVPALYPAIDTAIAKCTKVIEDHSMPGAAKMSAKKEENNSFIDENWITIGRAFYIRRDYDAARKNFTFIKKFYENDPSNYVGELWMARTKLELGNVTEAGFHLNSLRNVIAEQEAKGWIEVRLEQFKKPEKGEKILPPLPPNFYESYYLTNAHYHQLKGEKDSLKDNLILSLDAIKRKKDKARIYFLLGQLEEQDGKRSNAKDYYAKVLKCTPRFEMAFNARLKRAMLGGDEKLIKELQKMLKDAKNAEYKDQIYYALAQIDLNKNNEPQAFVNLTNSAFYSTSNARQKAMAYELMGDLKFKKREYVVAQKYYDSTTQFMPDTYPNAEGIRNKATKLNDLVVAVETAQTQDSLLRIANLSESEREAYLAEVLDILKKREEERKRKEAEKLAMLAKNEVNFNQTQGGSKWYFRNAKTRSEGYDEFKRQWGTREDEDNWRRSEKIQTANQATQLDSGAVDSSAVTNNNQSPVKPALTVDDLRKNVPLTDSSKQVSRELLAKSLYDAGIIYKEQLKEPEIASRQFNRVVELPYESEYKLMAAFELYRLTQNTQPAIASVHKSFILNNYPNSDYANYIRDPDYFLKKKGLDALAEKEYVKALDRYTSGLYYPALSQAETVLQEEPQNAFRSKYMLLKAMCQGRLNADKQSIKPTLEQLIREFPGTPEEARAKELLAILKNGYSKNEVVTFESKFIYNYQDNVKHIVLVFLKEDDNSGLAKSKISDFSREFFSKSQLKVSSKVFGTTQSVIFIEDFENDSKAREYIRVYKATRKHLLDLQNAKILAISVSNLKLLFETQQLKEYEDFYLEYY